MKWSDDIHLCPEKAEMLTDCLVEDWALPDPFLQWESACDELAYITWPDIIQHPVIHFSGYGCTLETLAHELAHLVEGPDEPTHGADHNFLTQLVALQLLEYLRDP